jgi:hypothetical protein
MAAKLEIEKGGMKFKKNVLLWNYWAKFNQTLLRWSLGVCEFPIGFYVKLGSAVGAILVEGPTAGLIFGKEPSNDYFIKI